MPVIPDFTDHSWQQSRSKAQLIVSILEGKDRLMPANRGMVSDELAAELVGYVRTFDPYRPPPAPAPVPVPVAAARTTGAEPLPAVVLTGDFDVDLNRLMTRLDGLKQQKRELLAATASAVPAVASAAAAPSSAAPSTVPPVSAVPAAPAAPAVAALPIPDRPFTADDVARGRDLFVGRRALANGGPACIACHAAYGTGWLEGGRLGPNLTKAYERLGGRTALSAHLRAPETPTMRPTYQRHGLESEEVQSLTAYLEDADRKGVENASSLPATFLLLGLGGSVLGLATVSAFWGSRFRPRGRPTLDGTAPPLPASRPEFAQSSQDYAGVGL
jgi:hypothetical protein